jgi:Spy/CpxP family protein refolding chaperone
MGSTSLRRAALATVAAGCLGVLACAATRTVPANAVSSVPVDGDANDDLNALVRHHHHGGVVMLVAFSLDTLGLPPGQSAAVAKIQARLFHALDPARQAEEALLATLADGVARGGIDKAKVDAAIARLEAASRLVGDGSVASLDELHAALSPEQRAALVDKVEAHAAVFKQADAVEGQLRDLARDIGLTGAQVQKIGERLAQRGPASASDPAAIDAIDAIVGRLGAFREDSFEARALADGGAACARMAARGAARMARFYEAVDAELTPDQRPALADVLREHATHEQNADVAAVGDP